MRDYHIDGIVLVFTEGSTLIDESQIDFYGSPATKITCGPAIGNTFPYLIVRDGHILDSSDWNTWFLVSILKNGEDVTPRRTNRSTYLWEKDPTGEVI